MKRIYKIIVFIILITLPFSSYSHVEHYDKLKRIEFDLYRNNTHIGKHIFKFKKIDDNLIVESKINFKIKKLGVILYTYFAEGTEIYKDGTLIKFNSITNQNKKDKFVNLELKNNEYIINGSSYKGNAPLNYALGTWWNHSIVEAPAQISAVSGRIIQQNVEFLGKEKITIGKNVFDTLHFQFTSSDKKLTKDKKLNTHIWYDEKSLNWVKASFKKKGKWEYRLLSVE